jgi:hypothetical protein
LAYSLREVKNCNKGKSGRKDFGLIIGRKKEEHFFGEGYCEKCTGEKRRRKKKGKKG